MASVSVSVGRTVPSWSVGLSLWDQLGAVGATGNDGADGTRATKRCELRGVTVAR